MTARRWLRRTCGRLGQALAMLVWALGVRRRVVLQNLRLAFPDRPEAERRAIARATYRNFGRMAAEVLLSAVAGTDPRDPAFLYENRALLEEALARGKGVIGCTAHFGPFERLAAAHSLSGVPVTMISRKMGKSRFNDLWRRARAQAGVEDLVVRRGQTLAAALRALAAGRLLGYVIDQNQPPERAVFPTFFGTPAATAPTPAILALRTGAPVLFILPLPMGDGRYRVVYEGPLEVPHTGDRAQDVLRFMQDLNDRLERRVRAHPEQWYWLHRRWKSRPGEEEGLPAIPAALRPAPLATGQPPLDSTAD